MRRLSILAMTTFVLAAAACGSDSGTEDSATTTTRAPDAAQAEQFQAALDDVRDDFKFPGVVARVITADYEWTGSSGTAGPDSTEPPTAADHTRIGSITKTFTVTAILQLMQDGKLSLDDPIGKYVPGLPNGDTATLRQLADMTSGIPSYTFDENFQNQLFGDPTKPWTPEQLLDIVRGDPPNFAPGEKWEYSNSNLIALGLVVEQVSGQSLGDYITERITEPIGMSETSFPDNADIPSPHLDGITEQGQPEGQTTDATNWDPSWAWAAGAMISTLDDLQIWAKAIGTGEGLYDQQTQDVRMSSFLYGLPPNTATAAYGLGLGDADGWLSHTGELPGFNTYFGYNQDTRDIILVAVNSDIPNAQNQNPAPAVVQKLQAALAGS
ncbi:serine hydrolase domain-containing protein [Rhodococcus sp. GXMU-t2271]|uniref:serine hydrolase domain-containing protein n=1 Tax=Rhodococcus sp. GXMU-t2271 TaxID=3059079 RepID=UPI00352AF8C6